MWNKYLSKERCVIFAIAGIVLFCVLHMPNIQRKEKVRSKNFSNVEIEKGINEIEEDENYSFKQKGPTTAEAYAKYLEKELERLLQSMEGVGAVKVVVMVDGSGSYVVLKDKPYSREIINERDAQGGSRNNSNIQDTETTVFGKMDNGDELPYVIKENMPEVKGVVVSCEGGNQKGVQKSIQDVIVALYGLDLHKIKVVKMNHVK